VANGFGNWSGFDPVVAPGQARFCIQNNAKHIVRHGCVAVWGKDEGGRPFFNKAKKFIVMLARHELASRIELDENEASLASSCATSTIMQGQQLPCAPHQDGRRYSMRSQQNRRG
jgi:hypothetical protein